MHLPAAMASQATALQGNLPELAGLPDFSPSHAGAHTVGRFSDWVARLLTGSRPLGVTLEGLVDCRDCAYWEPWGRRLSYPEDLHSPVLSLPQRTCQGVQEPGETPPP